MARLRTLVAFDSFAEGDAIEIPPEGLTIGRERAAGLPLTDGLVSRRHARIEPRGGGFVLVDAGSGNGTWLNERRVAEAPLADGDTIRVGKTLLLFCVDGAARPVPPPVPPPSPPMEAPPVIASWAPTLPAPPVAVPRKGRAAWIFLAAAGFAVAVVAVWLLVHRGRTRPGTTAAPVALPPPAAPLSLPDAALAGDAAQVKARLAEGADPKARNAIGMTAAELAVSSGNPDAVDALAGSADPNALLRAAAISGSEKVAERLLARGASAKAAGENGLTPLHLACGAGNARMVEALLAKGADPNARTRSGVTPLQRAAVVGDVEVVKALLAKGADPGLAGPDGTPYEIALANGSFDAADLLAR